MTDEEKIEAVTHALTGEFYPGQAVRVDDPNVGVHWQGRKGIVRDLGVAPSDGRKLVGVALGEHSDYEFIYFEHRSLKPL